MRVVFSDRGWEDYHVLVVLRLGTQSPLTLSYPTTRYPMNMQTKLILSALGLCALPLAQAQPVEFEDAIRLKMILAVFALDQCRLGDPLGQLESVKHLLSLGDHQTFGDFKIARLHVNSFVNSY